MAVVRPAGGRSHAPAASPGDAVGASAIRGASTAAVGVKQTAASATGAADRAATACGAMAAEAAPTVAAMGSAGRAVPGPIPPLSSMGRWRRSGEAQMVKRRAMGALEAEVSAALWASEKALTPAEVREAVGGDLAYTTVMTILTRLWQKGRLDRERSGRAYAYRPAVDEAEHFAGRMYDTLAEAKDREAALSRFVDELTPTETTLLRDLLDDDSVP